MCFPLDFQHSNRPRHSHHVPALSLISHLYLFAIGFKAPRVVPSSFYYIPTFDVVHHETNLLSRWFHVQSIEKAVSAGKVYVIRERFALALVVFSSVALRLFKLWCRTERETTKSVAGADKAWVFEVSIKFCLEIKLPCSTHEECSRERSWLAYRRKISWTLESFCLKMFTIETQKLHCNL